MKISLNWLKDYVQLDASVDEICRAITFLGFEVEQVLHTGAPQLSNVVVGEILTRAKHPNADKLSVCTVDVGPAGGVKTIVCGAPNCDAGRRVPVALPGAVLPGNFTIKQSKIRGQSSDGMMCAPDELGLGSEHAGLLILDGQPALGTPINDVLPPGDVVFDVEITPNRPDCQSHLGIARELSAWFKLPLIYPQEKFRGDLTDAGSRPELLRNVSVTAPQACPLYTAHVITGIKIGPSPEWMQRRLTAVGLRPINNVVDVGNYVMLETGQPLHAFDARKLGGNEIIVRPAADGEKIVTLDGKERTLNHRMLVIADAHKPVVIAGIMGGENSGVSDDTTDLVLECAIFNRQSIRWTSRQLGLSSDSSYRYERGVDPHSSLEAAWRAIDLIIETAGGKVVGPAFKVGGEAPWQREIVVTHDFICEQVGFDIPAAEMRASFEALELTVVREEPTERRGPAWTVNIPSWRDDLDRPIDLVEEVLRLYGTEKIPASRVVAPSLVGDDAPVVRFNRRVTDYLVGHDFHECVNYTLRPAKELKTWVSETAAAELALANPFVEDQSHLRPTLIMGLLDTLKLNQARGVPVSRLCETGRVFIERNGQNFECAAVGFVIAEDAERRWLKREPADFYTTKHHVAAVAAAAGIDLARHQPVPVTGSFCGWQEGHSACAGQMEHGWTARFGLLNLAMVHALGIEGKVYAGIFAILPERISAASSRRRYADFSLLPAALRDLAVVVDESTPAEEVRQQLVQLGRKATGSAFGVEQIEIFDVYRGAGLPEGKKSIAFSLVFRAAERTLTDDEVNGAFQKIQDELLKNASWQIRK
ncbi:phenylalanine--tRNA ligase subunit beta [Opitutus terrae]|uniref:Phenylalanine--tRNA ligase beta subunit n=1 Tax=Opitutus terrae (strain DSM 11246 / JCM 15787 / PB90-1) TaxID=452637 RepID=B1ZQN1_OPITP|nr:phenylalanine--tRNA ligase subunit beta [Opitutus terrae]ACB75640.1 phenylalanyl-tRNA synthetase, beta subunit [Opitutus terrae PB90-1]